MQAIDAFQFDNYFLVHQEIQLMFTNFFIKVINPNLLLKIYGESLPLQLDYQSLSVDAFKKPGAKNLMNFDYTFNNLRCEFFLCKRLLGILLFGTIPPFELNNFFIRSILLSGLSPSFLFYSRRLKKSLPLSSIRMKAGKSMTSILQIASIPSSG
jgi:hypothetical protein